MRTNTFWEAFHAFPFFDGGAELFRALFVFPSPTVRYTQEVWNLLT